jgi:hypothetical protein
LPQRGSVADPAAATKLEQTLVTRLAQGAKQGVFYRPVPRDPPAEACRLPHREAWCDCYERRGGRSHRVSAREAVGARPPRFIFR